MSSTIKEVIAVLLATPAALGVLAKIDARLNFLPIIERIILNYGKVLASLHDTLSNWLGIDWIDIDALMLSLFLTAQVTLGQKLIKQEYRNLYEKRFWSVLSVLSIALFALAFSALEAISSGIDFLPIILAPFSLLFLIYSLPKVFTIARNWADYKKNVKLVEISGFFLFLFIFLDSASDVKNSAETASSIGLKSAGFNFFITFYLLALSAYVSSRGIKGPAYVLLWVLGIYAIEWIGNVGLPTVDEYLNRVGA